MLKLEFSLKAISLRFDWWCHSELELRCVRLVKFILCLLRETLGTHYTGKDFHWSRFRITFNCCLTTFHRIKYLRKKSLKRPMFWLQTWHYLYRFQFYLCKSSSRVVLYIPNCFPVLKGVHEIVGIGKFSNLWLRVGCKKATRNNWVEGEQCLYPNYIVALVDQPERWISNTFQSNCLQGYVSYWV